MNEQQNTQSGINTILIVLLIVIILAVVIWFAGDFNSMQGEEQSNNEGSSVELDLQTNDE